MQNDLPYISSSNSIAYSKDTAFADDYLIFGGSVSTAQNKLDIISALGIIYSIDFALPKFRTFHIIGTTPQAGHLTLHASNWIPQRVNFSTSGFYKYLGSTKDYSGTHLQEDCILQDHISAVLSRISKKQDSIDHRVSYANTAITPLIMYRASLSDFTNERIDQIQGPLKRHLKAKANLPSNFPNGLVHGPWAEGGLGIPRFQDSMANDKWRIIYRSLKGPLHSREAIQGILLRASRLSNGHWHNALNEIKSSHLPHSWISSLIHSMEESKIQLQQFHNHHVNKHDKTCALLQLKLLHYRGHLSHTPDAQLLLPHLYD